MVKLLSKREITEATPRKARMVIKKMLLSEGIDLEALTEQKTFREETEFMVNAKGSTGKPSDDVDRGHYRLYEGCDWAQALTAFKDPTAYAHGKRLGYLTKLCNPEILLSIPIIETSLVRKIILEEGMKFKVGIDGRGGTCVTIYKGDSGAEAMNVYNNAEKYAKEKEGRGRGSPWRRVDEKLIRHMYLEFNLH